MATEEIKQYYDATANSETRSDLLHAADLVENSKIAIDCGCGAGADIEYLLSKGFFVHGFDVEKESIARCKKRFNNNANVALSQDTFSSFTYPKASLVLADASLFFCEESGFNSVWDKIYESLEPSGIFCGSFLGPRDTTAAPNYNSNAYWSDTSVFTEDEVKKLFTRYQILRFTEHESSGNTPDGKPHHWHIFSVVAKKSNKILQRKL